MIHLLGRSKKQKKRLLKVNRVGPVKQFSARKRQKDLVPKAIQSFLDHVLDDSLAPLVPYIAKARDLSDEEIMRWLLVLNLERAAG